VAKQRRYPDYDVWKENDKWDDHTRKIVVKRKAAQVEHQFFDPNQALLLQAIVSQLVNDYRLEVLTFIVQHLDESVASPIGEAQRKVGVPPKQELYRQGLAGVDAESRKRYKSGFLSLKQEEQKAVLEAVSQGEILDRQAWEQLSPVDFFKRLLYDAVSAYYSHPLVWSDIGYGGPAYPRGYVRVEKGLTDPWEAKANEP